MAKNRKQDRQRRQNRPQPGGDARTPDAERAQPDPEAPATPGKRKNRPLGHN